MKQSSTLKYTIIGAGKPVVFLHGFLESSSMWNVLELEKFNFQSILIDLPGHGFSPSLPAEVSISAMAAAVEETIQQLGLKDFGVVGHSMGGYVALELAKSNPGVQQVCLMNSSFWADSEKKKSDRNRVIEVVKENKIRFINEAIPGLFAMPEEHVDFINDLIVEATNIPAEAIIYATAAMRDRNANEEICLRLDDKLKIIQGEEDKSIPLQDMLSKTQGKNYNMTILPGVAHMSHVEATDVLQLLLTDFFQ